MSRRLSVCLSGMILCLASLSPATACGTPDTKRIMAKILTPEQFARIDQPMDTTPIAYSLEAPSNCEDGMADIFPCQNVDLLAVIQPGDLGATTGNDLWGWTDPESGREFAIIGLRNGTAFLEVTDPENPVYLGKLPSHGGLANERIWRDVKVYEHYAYVVADHTPMTHGLQIFDLTELLSLDGPPATLVETAHYGGFYRSHNLVLNEESGFLYAVGTESSVCNGGLSMFDLSKPLAPSLAGCFSQDGYTHDAQCVNYHGPDEDYQGHEICFASNVDAVTIVDVTDKQNPVQISTISYSDLHYSHQGWLTEDQRYFIHDDEADEMGEGHNTKTRVFDFADLDAPTQAPDHLGGLSVSDHNQYVVGEFTYQANYRGGLRILHLEDPATGKLREVAYLDTYPESNSSSWSGAWSVYPYFASGTVLVSDMNRGLFIVRPNLNGVLPFFSDGFESGDTTAWQ